MAMARQTAVDTVRQVARDAARSTRVVVNRTDVQGVLLEAQLPPEAELDEDARLLHQFSPDFVIFPDATAGSDRPSKPGREDYHPRPVEAYLDRVTPYVASPRGWVSGVYVVATTVLMGSIATMWLLRLIGAEVGGGVLSLVVLSGAALGAISLSLVLQAPLSLQRLRARAAGGKAATERLGVRRAWFEQPRQSMTADLAWRRYEREVVRSTKYPRTSYARVIHVGAERYLQYWQFYVFNDWHNTHEADWEVAVVRVARAGDAWVPIGGAYSSHFGGHWRVPGDMQWRRGTHPVVYVARGSHAQYFEAKEGGYTATLTQSFGSLQIQIGNRNWKDDLAADPDPGAPPLEYVLRVMPPVAADVEWTADVHRDWWWLRYRGLWGGSGAIGGPVDEGDRWTNPANWVAQTFQRDSPDWTTLAASGAPDAG